LNGIENITANNGWAMAAVGATIVFAGLVVLSFVISQIHKILSFWEDRQQKSENAVKPEDKPVAKPAAKPEVKSVEKAKEPAPQPNPLDAKKLADDYQPLVEELGESFNLTQLYELTKNKNLPHAHLSITYLREADILIPLGDGNFSWKK
jgi:hypothetical protein